MPLRDEQVGAENGVLRSVAYLDGGGGVVLQKVQAKQGKAYVWDGDGGRALVTELVGDEVVLV